MISKSNGLSFVRNFRWMGIKVSVRQTQQGPSQHCLSSCCQETWKSGKSYNMVNTVIACKSRKNCCGMMVASQSQSRGSAAVMQNLGWTQCCRSHKFVLALLGNNCGRGEAGCMYPLLSFNGWSLLIVADYHQCQFLSQFKQQGPV